VISIKIHEEVLNDPDRRNDRRRALSPQCWACCSPIIVSYCCCPSQRYTYVPSSLPSMQSFLPSSTQSIIIHRPLLHEN